MKTLDASRSPMGARADHDSRLGIGNLRKGPQIHRPICGAPEWRKVYWRFPMALVQQNENMPAEMIMDGRRRSGLISLEAPDIRLRTSARKPKIPIIKERIP
tara:strand:- start:2475 stop:2780 length:306 start_codon:yes stop_codon:yes gene_type:complete